MERDAYRGMAAAADGHCMPVGLTRAFGPPAACAVIAVLIYVVHGSWTPRGAERHDAP